MISMQEWMSTVEYRISDGSEFLWHCFGEHAYCLDSYGTDQSSASIIFDRKNQTVYQVSVCDAKNNRAYRLTHPDFEPAHTQECIDRNVEDVAWENTPWIELELTEDFIEKAQAILNSRTYDTRIMISLDLEEDQVQMLHQLASERGTSIDAVVESILRDEIARLEALKTQTPT